MPSNIPLWTFGVAFRLRLVTFTDQAHRAHRPLGGILAWLRGSSDRSLARGPLPQAPRWHPRVARQASIDSSARPPCPQVPQWHPRVARGASIDPLARGPSTEPLLGQGRVPKHLPTNLKPVSCRCFGRTSVRHTRREASRWHHGVAKQSSIGSSSMK